MPVPLTGASAIRGQPVFFAGDLGQALLGQEIDELHRVIFAENGT
jgi:hypothetical protein